MQLRVISTGELFQAGKKIGCNKVETLHSNQFKSMPSCNAGGRQQNQSSLCLDIIMA